MPLPEPRDGETREDFLGRCLSNEQVQADFGEGTDRATAVCGRIFDDMQKGVRRQMFESFFVLEDGRALHQGDELPDGLETLKVSERRWAIIRESPDGSNTARSLGDVTGTEAQRQALRAAERAPVGTRIIVGRAMGKLGARTLFRERFGFTSTRDMEKKEMEDVEKGLLKKIGGAILRMASGAAEIDDETDDPPPYKIKKDGDSGGVRLILANGMDGGRYDSEEAAQSAFEAMDKQVGGPWADGPDNPVWMFVLGTPTLTDKVRGLHLSGARGEIFRNNYLNPSGLTRSSVSVASLAPHETPDGVGRDAVANFHLEDFIKLLESSRPRRIVALGKSTAKFLGEVADISLPYPSGDVDSREIRRQMLMCLKSTNGEPVEKRLDVLRNRIRVEKVAYAGNLCKADDEKRIATYLVYPHSEVDAHGEFASKEAVEEAAHRYLSEYRNVGKHHREEAGGVVVESWLAKTDFTLGEQEVKEGDWLASIKWSEEDWQEVRSGVTPGISMGGIARRRPA